VTGSPSSRRRYKTSRARFAPVSCSRAMRDPLPFLLMPPRAAAKPGALHQIGPGKSASRGPPRSLRCYPGRHQRCQMERVSRYRDIQKACMRLALAHGKSRTPGPPGSPGNPIVLLGRWHVVSTQVKAAARATQASWCCVQCRAVITQRQRQTRVNLQASRCRPGRLWLRGCFAPGRSGVTRSSLRSAA